ncbi:hypothetical protein A2303_05485 [Candidatus Falkowbacteria bacterium RIFOXYB2_FULL_47_14]|uniref:DUF262 domain-containing protein n=1 Tax=Candidatus Falkowbacteria bacterium RIFOXYA2_FULL_47_19 TaxID=1797994 RepID=A0A1F5SEM0_9BACT|nr:MAG: hypothetical protein A2227_06890 [Candidatus Falkowbacteria bacterium RIFOXYA2_FULL_47_19]OGF35302.1 MAG: hypothetical protein A2468_00040 [Candidatus Falkowbacteria bacterium RIFOXYC2_FULL_46_15]OGF43739.1 MAG: hypothetical protein A2303_05485 [Candidatus Falkowbacteria bacterium RIFOXYB2_FULL_47_14]
MASFDEKSTGNKTFEKLRKKFEFFCLPKNQRPYVWTKDKVTKLFNNIMENESGYYIGNILSQKINSSDSVEIIDGQQRIITIILCLSALRNVLIEIAKKSDKILSTKIREYAKNIDSYYLKYLPSGNTDTQEIKIKIHKENIHNILEKIILKKEEFKTKADLDNLDDNEKHIVNIYKHVFKLLHEHISNNQRIELSKENSSKYFKKAKEIKEKIVNAQFILIVCEKNNDIFNMFEGLNATGQALNQIDLVKNVVMSYCKTPKYEQRIESLWYELESLFEETDYKLFEKFLRYYWISKNGYIRGSEVFSSIKQAVENEDERGITILIGELIDNAKIYLALRRNDQVNELRKISKNKISIESVKKIEKYQHLGLDQVYGVLLSLVNRYLSDSSLTEKIFNNELDKLWIFALRAKIIGVIPSKYERGFASQCKKIKEFQGNDYNKLSDQFYKDLKILVESDEEFKKNFCDDIKYSKDNKLTTILLNDIRKHQDKTNSKYGYDEVSREHILDRDPKNWNLKKADVKNFVNNIGNLTLFDKNENGKLNDASPDKKMEAYKNDIFIMNKDIERKYRDNFLTDPEEAIHKRGADLAEIANVIYRI